MIVFQELKLNIINQKGDMQNSLEATGSWARQTRCHDLAERMNSPGRSLNADLPDHRARRATSIQEPSSSNFQSPQSCWLQELPKLLLVEETNHRLGRSQVWPRTFFWRWPSWDISHCTIQYWGLLTLLVLKPEEHQILTFHESLLTGGKWLRFQTPAFWS